jgi:hypothetical protein
VLSGNSVVATTGAGSTTTPVVGGAVLSIKLLVVDSGEADLSLLLGGS